MGLSCKPFDKMRSITRKMENEISKEIQKAKGKKENHNNN